MKRIRPIMPLVAISLAGGLQAQNLALDTSTAKAPTILMHRDRVTMGCESDFTSIAVLSNCPYTIKEAPEWLSVTKESNGNLTLFSSYYVEHDTDRSGRILLESAGGECSQELTISQTANRDAASSIKGDTRLAMTGVASQYQNGENIDKTYDNDPTTIYHSPWGDTRFPITLTYTLKTPSYVDYLLYTPRQSGDNGNFGEIVVEYTLGSAPNHWIHLAAKELGFSSSSTRIDFEEGGIDHIAKVRITVKSGYGGFASCAEMGLYQSDKETSALFESYFIDKLCTTLKPEVDTKMASKITHPYVKQLVNKVLQGNYSKRYRVGEFEAYRTLSSLAHELKTSTYNFYENPTGIYFDKDEKLVLFVEGIEEEPISLLIKSFGPESYPGEGQPQSSYSLKNGVNVIHTLNRGNGYISYFSDQYESLPKVKIHFAMAKENGYFDLGRGDDNIYWKELLKNSCSDIIDVRTPRMQVACLTNPLKSVCPEQGVELAQLYDYNVYLQRQIMGLTYYNREPKNRQFARPVSGGIYADGIGAALYYEAYGDWMTPDPEKFGFWGFGHELGHVNQVRPGFKWVGCGETTNNIYAVWVSHKQGGGYHNLEDEHTGINDYQGLRGGRFQAYLEEGVRKGNSWQLQEGPDYFGSTPVSVTVMDKDYDGNHVGTITTTKRNYDHFVKVIPMWQLLLDTEELGNHPNAFGKVIEGIRNYPHEEMMTDGQLQVKFMRSFCDSTQINYLPFFEKAGLCRPINSYIEDYAPGWLKISQEMIDELNAYIESKGYPRCTDELNYMTAYNWQVYKERAPLTTTATINSGCTRHASGRIQVDNDVWENAVAYETYNAEDKLIRITMFGLGDGQRSRKYTQVLWPNSEMEKSAYIMAVGFDGTRVKCYQP